MKQASIKSVLGAVAAFSFIAAFPMSAQSAEMAGKSERGIECAAGPSHATRLEWGLPTADCTAASQEEMKTQSGVMGPIRSSERARLSDSAEAAQSASFGAPHTLYGAQPTPY